MGIIKLDSAKLSPTETALALVGMMLINFLIGGLCLEYVVEFWGARLQGAPVDAPFLLCGLTSLFVAQIVIPVACATLIVSYTVGM